MPVPASIRRSAFLLCALLSFWAPGCSRYGDIKNIGSSGKAIVCFGDSLTYGTGAGPGEDYPSLLSSKLGIPVVNAGVPGNTTHDALARLDQDVLRHDPFLVVVLFGGNDFFQKLPRSQTFSNTWEIVGRIEAAGAMVVLLTVKIGLLKDEYRDGYKKVAKETGSLFVPNVLKGIFGRPSLMADGIHPNGAGYRRMADRIYDEIKPLIEENNRRRKVF